MTGVAPPDRRRIAGDGLVATVDATRGAKIVSLVDRHDYDWLLAPRELVPEARNGASFTAAEMGGWDECAPSIVEAAAPDGRPVPDHGDLWDVAWVGDGESLTGHGRSLDYDLRRSIRSAPGGLRFDYTVVAAGNISFLWAAHPQFAAPTGSRVLLDAVEVVDVLDERAPRRMWSAAIDGIDSVEPGGCRKVFAAPEHPVASAALEIPGRGRLTLRWPTEIAPYLGVWFDRGAYAREPVIALEPSTGFYDSLATAVGYGRVLELQAGRPVQWSVEVSVA